MKEDIPFTFHSRRMDLRGGINYCARCAKRKLSGERLLKYSVILTIVTLLWVALGPDLRQDAAAYGDATGAGEELTGNAAAINVTPRVSTLKNYRPTGDGSKEKDKGAFEYLNQLRRQNGRPAMTWDDRIYELAVYRSKDMDERSYLDHINPEGKCAQTCRERFNITYSALAENIFKIYSLGNKTIKFTADPKDAVDYWMASRGHRYNLLYGHHIAGAIGCYNSRCTFLGGSNFTGDTTYPGEGVCLHTGALGGGGCYTAKEGDAFWADAPKQLDEM